VDLTPFEFTRLGMLLSKSTKLGANDSYSRVVYPHSALYAECVTVHVRLIAEYVII
jgi:hypothetical protein